MVIKTAVSGYIKKKVPKIIDEAKDIAKENIVDTGLEKGVEVTEEKVAPSILRTIEKKADDFAEKTIAEASSKDLKTRVKGTVKIAAPAIVAAPFIAKQELKEKDKIDFKALAEKSGHPKDFPITDYDHEVLLKDYDFEPISENENESYDLLELGFLPHLEFEKLRNSKAYKLLKDNKLDTSELEGFEKVHGAGAIKLPNPHHDKFDEKTLLEEIKKDAHTVFEPLLDFIVETPKDLILSTGVAAANGVDVAVNLIPLIDKVFDYAGTPVGFQKLDALDDKKVMAFAKDLDVKVDKAREWIKKYKKDDNFVSQLIGIMGQDALYSIPIYNKLTSLGMPKYPAFFISGGIGGAIGIEKEIFGQESTFLLHWYSKDIQNIKNLVGILPNTPADEIADEVVQALEYGAFSVAIPAVIQGLKFMKNNIPFYADKTTTKKTKRKSKTK